MAQTYKVHQRFFPQVALGATTSNVVVAEIDLNGTDLLNGASGDAIYSVSSWTLVYNNSSTLYPMVHYHEAAIQKRSSTYTDQAFELINTGSVGALDVTINRTIASTSLFRIRASNVGTLTYSVKVHMVVRMYNV